MSIEKVIESLKAQAEFDELLRDILVDRANQNGTPLDPDRALDAIKSGIDPTISRVLEKGIVRPKR